MYMYISIKLWRYFINFVGKVVNLFGYAIRAAAVNAWRILMNFYLFIKVKKGGELVHVYVWEHLVNLNNRIVWWIFTKLGRDKVLMIPHIHMYWILCQIAQGWIQGRAKIGHGGSLLQRTSSSDRKATVTNWMHSKYLEAFGKKCCYFWFHSEVKFLTRFDVFLDLVILVYFNAISIDFYSVKSFICINLV